MSHSFDLDVMVKNIGIAIEKVEISIKLVCRLCTKIINLLMT
jgi:hypothetical protein